MILGSGGGGGFNGSIVRPIRNHPPDPRIKFFLNGTTPLLYQTEVFFEEFFEMLGASMILYSASRLALTRAHQLEPAKTEIALQPMLLKSNPIS